MCFLNDLLRLKTEHTDSSKTEYTESLLRPKTTLPNFFRFESNNTEQIKRTDAFFSFEIGTN